MVGEGSKNTELREEEGGTEAVVNTAGSVFWGFVYAFFMLQPQNRMRKRQHVNTKGQRPRKQRPKHENAIRERLGVNNSKSP